MPRPYVILDDFFVLDPHNPMQVVGHDNICIQLNLWEVIRDVFPTLLSDLPRFV